MVDARGGALPGQASSAHDRRSRVLVIVHIFSATANLLSLSCDIIFVETTSTYFEVDVAHGQADLDLAE